MRLHLTAGAALAALSVLTAQSPSPSPEPSTMSLPVIGHTHSKGFCTTVRDGVAPAVLGLMKTDELIGASHRALLKAGHDATLSHDATFATNAVDIDRIYLSRVADLMAHNLDTVRRTLSDPKRFPKTAVTDDDLRALLLKAQLQAVADRQNDDYNHLNGILEVVEMRQMRSEVSAAMAGSVGPGGANLSAPVNGFLDSSSPLPGSGPVPLGGSGHVAETKMIGHTIWDQLATDVEIQQARIAQAEQTLTPAVVAAATGCRDEGASPAPSASP